MEKRLVLFFVLTFLIFALHSKIFGPPPHKEKISQKTPVSESVPESNDLIASSEKSQLLPESSIQEAEIYYLENPFMKIGFSTLGGSIKNCLLRSTTIIRGDDHLLFDNQTPMFQPGSLTRFGDYGDLSQVLFKKVDQTSTSITFETLLLNEIKITKLYTFDPTEYILKYEVSIENLTQKTIEIFKGYDVSIQGVPSEGKKDIKNLLQVNYILGEGTGSFKKKKVQKIKERSVELDMIHWAGFRSKYFITILDPMEMGSGIIFDAIDRVGKYYLAALRMSDFTLGSQESLSHQFRFYLGPNDWDHLEACNEGYEAILGFNGFLGPVTKFLLRSLRLFSRWVHNYGLAIILLTILIKLLFFPLTHMSFKSMKKMKLIQPELTVLKETYKNNPRKMQQETMALYKKHGVNPLGGCLPMVIQIPIFIAFYQLLMGSIELRGASFLWIQNLSEPDTLLHLGPFPLNILPLIMGVSMVWQQKMTPVTDANQAKVMMIMPVIFTFIFYSMGSGLVLYWLTNNILTIAQQYWSHSSMDDHLKSPSTSRMAVKKKHSKKTDK